MAAFSELDREMIKEKQRSGIKLAKQKGKYWGRVKNIRINIRGSTMRLNYEKQQIKR